jgi:hypothetical protein
VTAVRAAASDDASPVSRAQQSPRYEVQLSETPDGWLLTVTVSPQTAADLPGAVRSGHRQLGSGEMSMSITPNLVPGEPFEISALNIIVAGPKRRPRPGR